MYPADGRKMPDIYTAAAPSCATSCNGELGRFPLFNFWGPRAGIESSALDRRRARDDRTTTQQRRR